MKDLGKTLGLYYHTARHLKAVQVMHRLRRTVASHVLAPRVAPPPEHARYQLAGLPVSVERRLLTRDTRTAVARADSILQGTFSFVGESVSEWEEVNWTAPEQSRLWRFTLHGFDWLFDLAAAHEKTRDQAYYARFRELAESWMRANRTIAGDAWHPYTVSLRIVNWLLASLAFNRELEGDSGFRERLLGSTHQQTEYLSRHLEYDLLANHLFKNIKALFVAGTFFADPKASHWLQRGTKLLSEQLNEQILADGCHFERSPTYHCLVLEDVLDCLLFADASEAAIAEVLRCKAIAMTSYLRSLLFPDGFYPLFNDAAYNMAPTPAEVLAYAEAALGAGHRALPRACTGTGEHTDVTHHRESGYVMVTSPRLMLGFDGAELGPDYQLGHAHCDLFSFELAVDGVRVIVDSGTPTYEENELRNACRSTSAHNTVMLDGEEQAEIWKSFRIGRRPRPHDVNIQHEDRLVAISGRHDGYQRLKGRPVHERTLFIIDGTIVVVFDSICGAGRHRAASFLHLHPSANYDAHARRAQVGNAALSVVPLKGCAFSVEQGFYAPRMGSKQDATVLRMESEGVLPMTLGYTLSTDESAVQSFSSEGGNRLDIVTRKGTHSLSREGNHWQCRSVP